MALPPFVCIQGDYLVVEGNQNPTMCDYHLKLVAFDPVSESKDELKETHGLTDKRFAPGRPELNDKIK